MHAHSTHNRCTHVRNATKNDDMLALIYATHTECDVLLILHLFLGLWLRVSVEDWVRMDNNDEMMFSARRRIFGFLIYAICCLFAVSAVPYVVVLIMTRFEEISTDDVVVDRIMSGCIYNPKRWHMLTNMMQHMPCHKSVRTMHR